MRIKSIGIKKQGKCLAISWYSGEEENTLNSVTDPEPPLLSFKEAWDSLAAAMWDYMSLSSEYPPGISRYKRPKKTLRLQSMVFVKTDTDKGHLEKIRMVLAFCPFEMVSDIAVIRMPPIYIKNTYVDDDAEECCNAGEASPALYKLIEKVKEEAERYINGERMQMVIPGMEDKNKRIINVVDMEDREMELLKEEQAADLAAEAAQATKPVKRRK